MVCQEERVAKPVLQAWENFITEYKVKIEVTTFAIENKHRYFVRVGSFDATRHPVKMPIHYWRDRNNKELSPTRLRINKLTANFAASVGSMGISFDDSFFDNIETVVFFYFLFLLLIIDLPDNKTFNF